MLYKLMTYINVSSITDFIYIPFAGAFCKLTLAHSNRNRTHGRFKAGMRASDKGF